ncbi:hypothetical protein [Paenibacillus turpanensis]|uniref:prenylated flavin chaperone LpdD n=1 Tax=Paenibacillus turpanensis TaxID=2689078 RepID=UPI00140D5730|nr:hypothetical protein [Paenibacillus turpanensis]
MKDDQIAQPNIYGISIQAVIMGKDVLFSVTGGEAHIGAAATAFYSEEGTVHSDVLILPGHREGELAVELARMAALALSCTVVVVAGIHLHQPTKQDIEEVVAETKREMALMLSRWDRVKPACMESFSS